MTPECRAWTEQMVDRWSARAVVRRGVGQPVDLTIAGILESIVAGYRLRMAAASVVDPAVAEWEGRLARIEPYRGEDGIWINAGTIMDAVRHDLRCRIAVARREPVPAAILGPARGPPAGPMFEPPPEPLPFVSGPQLDMFAS